MSTASAYIGSPESLPPPGPDFRALLEQAGFHIRGRRADCLYCEGSSRLTVSFNDEVAYCHRCHWTRNVRTLAHDLRITLAPETRERREQRQRAALFSEWVNTCHEILIRHMNRLTRRAELAKAALRQFPDCEPAWAALADFYHSEASFFGALDFLVCDKTSRWLEWPMEREQVLIAFSDACDHVDVADAF